MSIFVPSNREKRAFVEALDSFDATRLEVQAYAATPRGREVMSFASNPAGVGILAYPMLTRLDPASLSPLGDNLGDRLKSVQRGGASHPRLHPDLYAHFEELGYYGLQTAVTLQRHLEADACVHVCSADGSAEGRALGSLLQAEDELQSWMVIRRHADVDQLKEATAEVDRLEQRKVEVVRSLGDFSELLPPSVERLLSRERSHIATVDQMKALAQDVRLPEDIRTFCDGVDTARRSLLHDGIKSCRASLRRSPHRDLKDAFAKAEADYERLDRPQSSLGSALFRAIKGVHRSFEELDRYRDIPEYRSRQIAQYLDKVQTLLGPDAPRNFGRQLDDAVVDLNLDLAKSREATPKREIDISEGR